MSKIAVIAHDKFKQDLFLFLSEKKSWFYGREIIATGRTADFLEKRDINLPLSHVNKGSEGGYLQITDMINSKGIGMVFFFRDSEIDQPYHQDIIDLLNACDKNNIPVSTNQSAAELLIIGKIRMEAAEKVSSRIHKG